MLSLLATNLRKRLAGSSSPSHSPAISRLGHFRFRHRLTSLHAACWSFAARFTVLTATRFSRLLRTEPTAFLATWLTITNQFQWWQTATDRFSLPAAATAMSSTTLACCSTSPPRNSLARLTQRFRTATYLWLRRVLISFRSAETIARPSETRSSGAP